MGNKIWCRYCKEYVHIKWDCPKLKKNRDKQGDGNKCENSSVANVAVADGDDLVDSSELLVVSVDTSSVGHCASSASVSYDMSFNTS